MTEFQKQTVQFGRSPNVVFFGNFTNEFDDIPRSGRSTGFFSFRKHSPKDLEFVVSPFEKSFGRNKNQMFSPIPIQIRKDNKLQSFKGFCMKFLFLSFVGDKLTFKKQNPSGFLGLFSNLTKKMEKKYEIEKERDLVKQTLVPSWIYNEFRINYIRNFKVLLRLLLFS